MEIEHGEVCAACLTRPGRIDRTLTLGPYLFPMDKMLLALKYKKHIQLARELGQRLAEKIIQSGLPMPDSLVPVPLHPRRLIRRGFNQAQEIARVLSASLDVPLDCWSARRVINTSPQFLLNPAQRRKNLVGAFAVRPRPGYETVAIVDDIVTTGGTADELAGELHKAGVSRAWLWACAHAGTGTQVSRFSTVSAFSSINSRRGST